MVQLTLEMITYFSHVITLLQWSLFLETDWFQGEAIRSRIDPFEGTGKAKGRREKADHLSGTEWSDFKFNFLVLFPKSFLEWINIYLLINNSKGEKKKRAGPLLLPQEDTRVCVQIKAFLCLRRTVGIDMNEWNSLSQISQSNVSIEIKKLL